jgi:hypothetical protein
MSTIVHLRNRTLSRAVGTCGGAALTLLTFASPDYSGFRAFGCAAFAKVPDAQRKKLYPKPIRGVFVGYPPNSHGYRIYNPATRRIATYVHVVFQEDVSGFVRSLKPHLALDTLPNPVVP